MPDGGLVTLESANKERQTRLGGIGQVIADEIQKRLQTETRCVVLGHLQRGGLTHLFRPLPCNAVRRACSAIN